MDNTGSLKVKVIYFFFFMILTVLRSTNQVLCKMFLVWDLSTIFQISPGLLVWGTKTVGKQIFLLCHIMETYYLHGLSLLATYQNFSYSLQFIGKQLTYKLCIPRLCFMCLLVLVYCLLVQLLFLILIWVVLWKLLQRNDVTCKQSFVSSSTILNVLFSFCASLSQVGLLVQQEW